MRRNYSHNSSFNVALFQSQLRTHSIGRYITHRVEVDSTMITSKRDAQEGAPHGSIVIADRQTQGRGRADRKWFSSNGNLAFTLLLRPLQFQLMFQMNLAMAIAVVEAAHKEGVTDAKIKWPNDVWVKGKKLMGYIVDSDTHEDKLFTLIGVGMNLNQDMSASSDLPDEVKDNAVSLRTLLEKSVERESVLANICNRFEDLLQRDMSDVLNVYASHSLIIGRTIIVKPKRREDPEGYEAQAIGFTKEGMLQIKVGEEVKILSGEEVMVRLSEYENKLI